MNVHFKVRRLSYIFKELQRKEFTKEQLKEKIEFHMDRYVCDSTLEKDFYFIQNELGCDLEHIGRGKYRINSDESFWHYFIQFCEV